MNRDYLFEVGLPEYLALDLQRVKDNDWSDSLYDCYLEELWGSINSAFYDETITPEQADYLRDKYYFSNLR